MEDEHGCRVCGRSATEIHDTRRLVDALAELAIRHQYDNVDEFTAWVGRKLAKKIRARAPG